MTSIDTNNPSTESSIPPSVPGNDLTAVVGGVGHILRGAFSDLYSSSASADSSSSSSEIFTTSSEPNNNNNTIPRYEDTDELREVS